MERKPVSDPNLAALGGFQGDIDRSSNFRQRAYDHNLGRNLRVAKLLGYLGMLRQRGAALTGMIDCSAAIRQNFSSSQTMAHMGQPTGPMQAAHYLPGRLRIGGNDIWQLATSLETRGHIEFLFAEVEHLPTAFNQADSAAESKGQAGGLCSALVDACAALFRQPAHGTPAAGRLPLEMVRCGYEAWFRGAMTALISAAVSKGSKPGAPPLDGDRFGGYTPESIAARSTARTTLRNRDESLSVLHYYLEDQPQRTWSWVIGRCQGALHEVELNFRG